MPLVPFELLPQQWSLEGGSPSKSLCGPFKRNCLGLQQPSSHSAIHSAGFYSPNYWDFSSWHCNSGEHLLWGWDPSFPRRNLCSGDIPSYFYLAHLVVWPAHFVSPPLLPVSMWLLQIPSCRTFIQLNSGSSEGWLFYSLAVILMCLWEDLSTMFTYTTFLTRSLF